MSEAIPAPTAAPELEKADVGAWLAVAAGTIGALMATLDTSIVNASLPTIQGEIGASGSEGTWISTAYLVAEIVMIPMAGWLARIFGLRTFLMIMTALFTVFSMICGVSHDLGQMIIGRIGQGFTGGAMIPMALTIVATRLPPRQQPLGIALFGMTAVLGPVLGPVVGGWLTENVSWHYAFFLNLPIGVGLGALLIFGLAHERTRWHMFAEADLLGIAGLTLGLGGLTTLLEEGQRERWFESEFICALALVSFVGFLLLAAGQVFSRRPVIQLRILFERAFGSVFLMSLMVGAALYGILYIIPQFLALVAGYNAEQSGDVTMISGIPTIMMLAVFPLLVRLIDLRAAIAFGLLLYGISCFIDVGLTTDAAGPQFFWSQVIRGFAQFFSMLFLNQAATSSVAHEFAEDASGLFNAARNLGGSMGLAVVGALQEQRTTFHASRLAESISGDSVIGQAAVASGGVGQLNQAIAGQATVMAFSDLYWVFGIALLVMIPLVLLLKPLPKGASVSLAA
ncbi:MAG: MDR family MFS transporter [Caulobacteraceae bacterium]|nr:MDR family MFS transporter [Caulobacteraceae bacterium]